MSILDEIVSDGIKKDKNGNFLLLLLAIIVGLIYGSFVFLSTKIDKLEASDKVHEELLHKLDKDVAVMKSGHHGSQ